MKGTGIWMNKGMYETASVSGSLSKGNFSFRNVRFFLTYCYWMRQGPQKSKHRLRNRLISDDLPPHASRSSKWKSFSPNFMWLSSSSHTSHKPGYFCRLLKKLFNIQRRDESGKHDCVGYGCGMAATTYTLQDWGNLHTNFRLNVAVAFGEF